MKKLLVISCCLLLIACSEQKSRWKIIEEKEKQELNSGIKNDTIFLDFAFGMTEDQVNKKLSQLLESGKISAPNKSYEYKFTFDYPKEAIATFRTEYFNGKLYEFTLKIDADDQTEAEIIQLKLVSLYMQKYGSPIKVPSVLNETESDYLFINGNRQIEICYPLYGTVFIDYTDLTIKNEKQFQDEKQNLQKQDSVKRDI